MPDNSSAAVIGAGVSGLTTGIILNLAGYSTTIYAGDIPTWYAYECNRPELSSLYAAASVLPHGVVIDDPIFHLERSQDFFDRLEQMGGFAVRTQRHYELFERRPPNDPAYLSAARNLSRTVSNRALTRTGGAPVYGWTFDAYVVDMPQYLRQLLQFYRETGGRIVEKQMERRDLQTVEEDLLVNCGGIGGWRLVEDSAPYRITRGHLVYVDVPASVLPEDWRPFSYSYMPRREIYCQPGGDPADVYFYPRTDRWVLGGSRQVVASDEHPEGISAEHPSTVRVGDVEVPEPIISLNRHLLKRSIGIDIARHPMQAAFGYRFERDPVRLELSLVDGRPIVHNYGHGGAGVTFSWSCAVEVLDVIESTT